MYLAVAQFAIVQIGFLGTFTSQFCHTSNRLSISFVVLDLLFDNLGHIQVLVQVVIDFGLDEVAHELVHADATIRFHCERTQLDLRLRLELRFLYIDGNRCDNT